MHCEFDLTKLTYPVTGAKPVDRLWFPNSVEHCGLILGAVHIHAVGSELQQQPRYDAILKFITRCSGLFRQSQPAVLVFVAYSGQV